MAKGILRNIKLAGMACAVPKNKVDIKEYYPVFGEKNVDNFSKLVGVNSKYIASEKQTSSDLAYTATEKLLENIGWDKSSIDGIIFITETPDYKAVPATACVLHERLGLKEDCFAFDVNLGCSGYVYGIHMVGSYMQQDNIKRMLLLVGDTYSKIISGDDSSTAMLFGDGGSATAFERADNTEDIAFLMKTKGEGYRSLIIPAGGCRNPVGIREKRSFGEGIVRNDYELYMSGTDVFQFSINSVPAVLREFNEIYSISEIDTDLYFLHQGNLFMLKTIAKRAKIPFEKVPVSIDRFGNTSVASIPITICDYMKDFKERQILKTVLCGYGVGLSWGAVSLEIDSSLCMPIIFTDEYYLDGGLEL